MKSAFSVGAARVPFSPDDDWFPLYRDLGTGPDTLPPHQRVNNVLTANLDTLYARAVAIRNADTTMLIITLDYIGVRGGEAKVRALSERFGIPEENIYLIATHTHNVPMTKIEPGWGASEDAVRALLQSQPDAARNHALFGERMNASIDEAAARALAGLKPASMGIGYSKSYVNGNRDQKFNGEYMMSYNGAGCSDKTAALIRFADAEGKTIARIANYACHAIVLYMNRCCENGTGGSTADLPGFVCRTYEEQDPGSVCLWTPAAGGNQNPIFMNFLGYPDPATGAVREEILEPGSYQLLKILGLRHFGDLREAEKSIDAYEDHMDLYSRRVRNDIPVREDWPAARWRGSAKEGCLTLITSAMQLGDVLLYGIGGELYSDVGEHLKAISPAKHTLICTLCVSTVPYMMNDQDLAAPTLFARRTPWKPGTLVPAMEGFLRHYKD